MCMVLTQVQYERWPYQYLSEPMVDVVDPKQVVTNACLIKVGLPGQCVWF